MGTANQNRLKCLYALYNQITSTLLGHPPEDRTDLNALKARVVSEIRDIEKSLDSRLNIVA